VSNDVSTPDLDLSPRPVAPRKTRTGGRKWAPIAIIVLVLAAGGVIVTQFLRSAVDYYCNVDEIGERDGCDANRRLRVQGVVDEGSVDFAAGYTQFTISFGGETLDVRYRGQPTGMFAECEPVVVHGRIGDDGALASDNIEVKHSNEYVEENPDRVNEAGPNCPVPDAAGAAPADA
jgi:cytochrome c-type biogenesis protein CcmE